MLSLNVHRFVRMTCVIGFVYAGTSASGGVDGVVTQHSSFAAFQNSTRASVIFQPFDGPTGGLGNIVYSENGFEVTVDATADSQAVYRDANGIGALFSQVGTEFKFAGRPVTSFAGFIRVTNAAHVPIAGAINLTLSTGENYVVSVPVGGVFVGVTSTTPFTSVRVDATPFTDFEAIDDVRVGVAAVASEPGDNCADAELVAPTGNSAQYPFTTDNNGSTAGFIAGSCPAAPALDNGRDIWLRLVAPISGVVTLSTCGATFDTILRVFDGCGQDGNGVGAPQVACNDDFCATSTGATTASQVQFRAVAGRSYVIRISGYNSAFGSGVLSYSAVPDCAADFNHTGGPQSVQDIFDFLTAWFGGC